MTHIYADGIRNVSLANGVLRVELVQAGADNKPTSVGTLLIPAGQAQNVVNGLTNSLKQISERLKAQQEQQQPAQEPPQEFHFE